MISYLTTLVLGAGASIPYDFPSGSALLRRLTYGLGKDRQTWQDVRSAGFSARDIEGFRLALERCGRPSVDAFLEHRREYVAIGKAAIAAFLLPCERDSSLFAERPEEGHWYEYLFQRMNTTFERFAENKLSIITFNYDRSLEYYLLHAVMNAYGVEESQAAAVLKKLSLVHIHGQLGILPEFQLGGVPFGARLDGSVVQKAAENLRIIHDDADDQGSVSKAQGLLSSAQRVYFLGFGFHDANLARLGLPSTCSGKRVYASGLGVTPAEALRIDKYFADNLEFDSDHGQCLDFLRHHSPLDL